MMDRLRSQLGRCFVLLGLFAWVATLLGSQLHHVFVQHTICAEHGEVLEVDSSSTGQVVVAPERVDGPVISAPEQDGHEDGCATDLVPLEVVSATVSIAIPAVLAVSQGKRHLHSAAPRGPPLAFAPKTGPPLRS